MSQLSLTGAGRSGSGAFVGAYDAIPNLVHVYEPARCTLSAYSGNALVRLRRASDDAESDFSHVSAANPELDTAAIAAWAGGAAYIVTIYDQKGSDDPTQGTKARQPLYVASAQNGHAGATFNGSNCVATTYAGGALAQPLVYYCVIIYPGVPDGVQRTATGAPINGIIFTKTVGDTWAVYAGSSLSLGNATNTTTILTAVVNGASSVGYINGGGATYGNAGTRTPNGMILGGESGSGSLIGGIHALVVSSSHTDAQRIAMRDALNTYWGVY